ncbi:MAG: hypothetical protein HYS18_12130 [Burkholderiales bacterium]|nr:hypothetical protein [Burkholderiales bacterium]
MKLIGSVAFAMALLMTGSSALCQSSARPLFVMSADQDETSFAGKWVWLIYTEAFERLGMRFQLIANPMTRQSLMADEGLIDGEVARVYGYGADHPNLVRVEEPVLDLVFSLYTADPELRLQRIEDLAAMNLRGEYRRGVGICEKTFKQLFPAERLSDVTKSEQGAKKLLAGRTDVYCDNEVSMIRIYRSPDIKDVGKVRKLISMGAAIPTYPYLHKKHAALAPRLAEMLKEIKAEGLIEIYRRQAERDMGWTK